MRIPTVTKGIKEEHQSTKHRHTVKVPTLLNAATKLSSLPQAIRQITTGANISTACLARSLDLSPTSLFRYRKGTRVPGNPIVLLALLDWPELISREKKEKP